MKRSELYLALWSEPATHIAARFGCSSPWIKRLCNLHNIPTPPPPYWATRKAGHPVQQAPLPEGEDVEIDIGKSLVKVDSPSFGSPHSGSSNHSEVPLQATSSPGKSVEAMKKRKHRRAPPISAQPIPRVSAPTPSDVRSPGDAAAELKQDAALAQEYAEQWHQHERVRSFLAGVAVHAVALQGEAGADLLAWITRVERRLDDVEPIRHLVRRLGARRV